MLVAMKYIDKVYLRNKFKFRATQKLVITKPAIERTHFHRFPLVSMLLVSANHRRPPHRKQNLAECACSFDLTAEETKKLYFTYVFTAHGIPKSILLPQKL